MRNIEKRALENQKYLIEKTEQDIQDYINWNEEFKQQVWNSYIFQLLQNHRLLSNTHNPEPIDFVDFRKNNKYSEVEDDIDRFLPWVVKELYWFYDENLFEIIFELDNKAKKALEFQSNISNNSEKVENTIDSQSNKIEWINISNEELAEKIGDLFYDSLSAVISSLWKCIDKKGVSDLLEDASKHILKAWKICLPYISHDFPEMKHTAEVKWLDIDKKELVKRISNLVNSELSDFLEKLSAKIQKDWEADKWRWRIKLANELFVCSDKLKQASEQISNII